MTNPSDLFGSGGGGGSFPKIDEFEGKLVLLKPSAIEEVPKPAQFGGKPGETQTRATTDVVVFDENGEWEVIEDMYFSQVGIVGPLKKAMKPGAKPFVLGRIGKVPSKIGKGQAGKYDSREKIEAGLAEWLRKGGKGEKPNFGWGLDDFTEEEAQIAMKYVMANSPLASASGE